MVIRDLGKGPWFGSLRGLYAEGWVYSQSDIWHMGAHGSQQKRVVVAGKGEVKGKDASFELTYLASTSGKGAKGMIIIHKKDLVHRVFWTESYNHVNRVEPTNTGMMGCIRSRVNKKGWERVMAA